MLDLLVRNATLPDGRTGIDIAIRDGRIADVAPGLEAPARESLTLDGWLVTPPFVDPHFHLDSTLSAGRPRVNRSGTLLEGIEIWADLAPTLTPEDVKSRARELCHWSIARGCLAIRSHVDVTDDSLVAVDALLELRRELSSVDRPPARRLPTERLLPLSELARQRLPRPRPGRGRGRGHSSFRAHHGRRHRVGEGPLRDRGRARPPRRHALRRDRRPQLPPRGDPGPGGRPPWTRGSGRRLAPHLHALDGQLLREQAPAPDARGAA